MGIFRHATLSLAEKRWLRRLRWRVFGIAVETSLLLFLLVLKFDVEHVLQHVFAALEALARLVVEAFLKGLWTWRQLVMLLAPVHYFCP